MSIYKEPTIYQQGLSNDDVIKLVSNSEWVDIAGKIGSVVIPSPSNVQIYWNKTLSLIYSRFYFAYGSTDSGNRIAYRFNDDIPGANGTGAASAMFNLESACYVFDYNVGLARYYPHVFTTDTPLTRTINVSMYNASRASFSGLMRFNSDFTEELQNYLDTH